MALVVRDGADTGAVRYVATAYRRPSGLWVAGEGPPYLDPRLIDPLHTVYPHDTVEIFGFNPDVDNALEDVWGGPTATYVFPTTPQQMRVVSTSASDTAAGTGTRQLHYHYLDGEYREQVETVTLNGTTPVLTAATDILRINGVHSWAVGSGGVPAGNISITNTAGTVTYGYVEAGLNLGRQAIYTVPVGRVCRISHWQAASGSTGEHFCRVLLRATSHAGVLLPGVRLVQDETGTQNGGLAIDLSPPITIPALADVVVSAISDGAAANVSAMGAFRGWLEAV